MTDLKSFNPVCPIPINNYPHILMAHGGGGRLMHNLIDKMFRTSFDNEYLSQENDSSILEFGDIRLAFTTDSYTVTPLFFPGGDIGSMAVYGTINDLLMSGAIPQYLSLSFVIEEGFEMEMLWKIVQSIERAADECHVSIVTGDTKVVERGKGDGIYVNTAGIGIIQTRLNIQPKSIEVGDAIILSGDIGRHGIAIMASREGLQFETEIQSDAASLLSPVKSLLDAEIDLHCMRDLTRGGLASALIELAEKTQLNFQIYENKIKVESQVHGACEMLGLDPLYVANEGRFISFVPPQQAETAVTTLNHVLEDTQAEIIGYVGEFGKGMVEMESVIGINRILDMISGEQLPRIC